MLNIPIKQDGDLFEADELNQIVELIDDLDIRTQDIRPKNNLFTGSNVFDGDVFFLQQVVFDGMEAPSSSTAPTLPEHLTRLVDVEVMVGDAIVNNFVYADTDDIRDLGW